MEIALYCPDYGFYAKEKDIIGKGGAFFTSISVGNLFGELLAFQFAEWLEASGSGKADFSLVETGAHDGQLASDILNWLRKHRGGIFSRAKYYIIEPSARRQTWQQETLKDFSETVRWVPEISALKSALQSSEAVIFSNELLDAMPVRRLGWDPQEKRWFEWGVTSKGESLVWTRMRAIEDHVAHFTFQNPEFEKLFAILPDGFTTEISPAAESWWREAAGVLKQGRLLAIDYGLTVEEFFTPERSEGTLRAYHHHRLNNNVLANPGEQDITAHVNFTAIQNAGEAAGLRTDAFMTQGKFLTQIAERIWQRPEAFGDWAHRARQFQTLTHPEHLGRPFRVLIQSRQSGD